MSPTHRSLPTRGPSILLVVLALAALVLTACGGGDDDTSSGSEATMSESMGGDMSEGDMSEGDMSEGDHESFAFGEPADEADADRTIEIEALDQLAYDPDSVEVSAGETVTFVVTNPGSAVHEFVIGDEELQQEHEQEMQDMAGSGMQMHDEPNALILQPGETKRITWHFADAGDITYACHQPGHYAGGMVGTVNLDG